MSYTKLLTTWLLACVALTACDDNGLPIVVAYTTART